jgi:ribosomal-protein-alanine N-acetyltransferase
MSALPKIEIRELLKPDLEAVIPLAQSVEDGPDWPPMVFAAMVSLGESEEHISLVAENLGTREVLGFVTCRLIPPEAEIENIVVSESCRRHGIGGQLLVELVEKLGDAGIETLHLEVRVSNQPAIGLYKSFGFSEAGRRPRYYSDPVEDAVLMTLRLA